MFYLCCVLQGLQLALRDMANPSDVDSRRQLAQHSIGTFHLSFDGGGFAHLFWNMGSDSNNMNLSIEGAVSLWQISRLLRSVFHSPPFDPASPVADDWKPGIWHPEPGEFRQLRDQRLHWELRLHPRKVRDRLCFHGNSQVCPNSQERGQGTELTASRNLCLLLCSVFGSWAFCCCCCSC